jgi:hypothetical protein
LVGTSQNHMRIDIFSLIEGCHVAPILSLSTNRQKSATYRKLRQVVCVGPKKEVLSHFRCGLTVPLGCARPGLGSGPISDLRRLDRVGFLMRWR